MRSRVLLTGLAAVSAVLLAACTGMTPSDPAGDGSAAGDPSEAPTAAAEPVVTVVDPAEAPDGSDDDEDSTEEGSEEDSTDDSSEEDGAETEEGTSEDASEPSGAASDSPDDIEFAPGDALTLAVEGGEFESVELVDTGHERMAPDTGETSEGDNLWQSTAGLAGNAEYEWTATTLDADGTEHTATGTFMTGAPTGSTQRTRSIIADDDTVGVGAPIIINFSSTVEDGYRDDVEQRLTVDVTDDDGEEREVEGSWAWLPDVDGHSRVHYRPKEHWPAYSQVSVDLPFEGVQLTESSHGAADMTLDFEIGREQLVTADAESHRMIVERDGEEVADYPTSLGTPEAPSYNGPHIVMSKTESYTMTSERWGYSTPVNWAVRIHNNGEFIHAAPWSTGVQGSQNVSHGCINLSTEDAAEYFETAIYGDPVEITGSSVDLTTESGEVSDWVYEWDEWQELSALD